MDVIMPQLGETVAEGTVLKWYKQVGDAVRADETLFDVETDKVSMEIPAPAAGVLTEIVVPEGVTAKVGARLAVIRAAGEEAAPSAGPSAPAPTAAAQASAGQASTTQASAAPAKSGAAPASPARGSAAAAQASTAPAAAVPLRARDGRGGPPLSPVVRRLCAELELDPGLISGTGPGGRITREDVLLYAESRRPAASAPAAARPPAADAQTRPLTLVRRRTAEHMARAWATVPHVMQAVEVNFAAIGALRRAHGPGWQAKEGFPLTFLPFIARAVCLALGKFPELNSVFEGDALRLNSRINLGIAVDLQREGLVVPVVKDAQARSLAELARAIDDLSSRARAGRLVPDDMSEGTYTLTNNGAFGTVITAPIVNAPQVAILSIDAIRKKPVVVEAAAGDGIAIAPVGMLVQSFDHRAVDGACSASFLTELKSILETRAWQDELRLEGSD